MSVSAQEKGYGNNPKEKPNMEQDLNMKQFHEGVAHTSENPLLAMCQAFSWILRKIKNYLEEEEKELTVS